MTSYKALLFNYLFTFKNEVPIIQHADAGENSDEGAVQMYSVALNDVIEAGRHLYVSVWAVNGVSAMSLKVSRRTST